MTIDGICDHTAVTPGEDIHNHYTGLLNSADTILYGRITYQLMEYWRPFTEKPSGETSMNDFATAIDRIRKIVFSRTLRDAGSPALDWDSATLADKPLEETVKELKQQAGGDILVGSPGLIVQLTRLNLIDEYQLCVHPQIAGKGRLLFEGIEEPTSLKFLKTKVFGSGAIILYYGRS